MTETSTQPLEHDCLFDRSDAALYLKTSARHITRLWLEHKIAGTKVGKKVRFKRSDLDAFIERSRVEAVQ